MSAAAEPAEPGATAIITHRLRDVAQAACEAWLGKMVAACRRWPGHLDTRNFRPIPDLTRTCTVSVRFDRRDPLQQWLASPDRRQLIEPAQPLLATGDDFLIRSGLDFWFVPEGAKAQVPKRWKQALATWAAIYPLVLLVPLAVLPGLRWLGVPEQPWLQTLVVTGVIVGLMVYVVMPRWTRVIRGWLFG